MNFCFDRGFLAGPKDVIPDEPQAYNWGRSGEGCSRLRCDRCRQWVTWRLEKARNYSCRCTDYKSASLECLGEVRYQGPGDIPIEMPPWRCVGHPIRTEADPYTSAELTVMFNCESPFQQLDREYHHWLGTARSQQLAEAVGAALRRGELPRQARLAGCMFYDIVPDAPGHLVLSEFISEDRDVIQRQCSALAKRVSKIPQFLEALRRMALQDESTIAAVRHLTNDRDWLLNHASDLMSIDPKVAEPLFQNTAVCGYNWDQDALRRLPLTAIRPFAATMPRRGLNREELHVYWERDFGWLCQNYSDLCRQASDFAYYSKSYFSERGWKPDPKTIQVWRQQAYLMNDCHGSIPQLIEHDRDWLIEHLPEVVEKSGVRGIWVLSALKEVGVDLRPLISPIRALDRIGDNWDQHLKWWFPND